MSDESTPQKRCAKCGELKLLNDFSRDNSKKDCLQNQCKACRAEYRSTHTAQISEYKRAWNAANLAAGRAYSRAWRAANPEISRAYYAANAEKRRDQARARRAANPDATRAYKRAYRAANPEAARTYDRTWRAANPEISRAKYQRRRARIKENGGTFTREEFYHMSLTQGGFCAYCQRQHDPDKLAIDHIVPLDQGGRHEAANIVLACPTCNSSKGNRTPDQWLNRWYWRQRRDEE
jgi:5-methylcytosine-specific restriction endonuclease McrA